MRSLRTDHVISGPIRRLKKGIRWQKQTYRQTDGHGDSMAESAQWGRFSKNILTTNMRPNWPTTIKFFNTGSKHKLFLTLTLNQL